MDWASSKALLDWAAVDKKAEFLLSSLSKMDASFDFLAFFPDCGEDILFLFMTTRRR